MRPSLSGSRTGSQPGAASGQQIRRAFPTPVSSRSGSPQLARPRAVPLDSPVPGQRRVLLGAGNNRTGGSPLSARAKGPSKAPRVLVLRAPHEAPRRGSLRAAAAPAHTAPSVPAMALLAHAAAVRRDAKGVDLYEDVQIAALRRPRLATAAAAVAARPAAGRNKSPSLQSDGACGAYENGRPPSEATTESSGSFGYELTDQDEAFMEVDEEVDGLADFCSLMLWG